MARIPITEQDDVPFRDLNGNGRMDPFEDRRLPPKARVEDLLGRLSVEEKVGLLVHPILGVGAPGDVDAPARRPAVLTPLLPSATAVVVDLGASDRALLDALTGRIPPR